MNLESTHRLIHRHLDGAATPEETSRLALALASDPEVARAFAEATRLDAGLRACLEAEVVSRRLAETARLESSPGGRRPHGAWGAVAATVMAAGMGLWWWRPWAERGGVPVVAGRVNPEPRRIVDVPGPPPTIRRPGELSLAAREMKRLAERFWLPERMGFSATSLEEAVAEVQKHASAVNHLRNPLIASFAVDLPEEIADTPVSASRGDLPLNAWLELLSAQAGCDLRYTETGVAFEPVDQPERVETRDFPLPTMADASAPAEAPARLFSYAPPWESEPDFRSFAAHGPSLAAAWGFPVPPEAKIRVRDDSVISVRHSRRELRRFEGLVAVAAADAGRPSVTFRAQEVLLPAPASAGMTGDFDAGLAAITDQNLVDLYITPQVLEFEGFINYGEPMVTQAVDANGQPTTVVLTESRIEQPVFASRAQAAAGSRVVGNDEAVGLLAQASEGGSTSRPLSWPRMNLPALSTVNRSIVTYDAGSTFNLNLDAETLRRAAEAQSKTAAGSEPPPDTATMANWLRTVSVETAVESEPPDPWQQAAKATVKFGEQAWLSTSVGPPITVGEGETPVLGFDLALSPPPPLNATARLEGEMVKMSGTFAPPAGSSAPTDFEAHVGPGQALVLQTEEARPVQGGQDVNDSLKSRFDVTLSHSLSIPIQLSEEALESIRKATADEATAETTAEFATTYEVATEFQVAENGRVESGAGAGGSADPVNWSFSVPAETRWSESFGRALTRSGPHFVHGVVISPVVEWP